MKKLLLALALVLAAPASAGVLVVDYSNDQSIYVTGNAQPARETSEMIVSTLTRFMPAESILVIPFRATKTVWLTEGRHYFGVMPGAAWTGAASQYVGYRTFDLVVHAAVRMPASFTTPACPESLTLAARWSSVPQLFVPSAGSGTSVKLAQGAACSTGVITNGAASATAGVFATRSTKGNQVYRGASWSSVFSSAEKVAPIDSTPPGIFRPLLAGGTTDNARAAGCTDCDAGSVVNSSGLFDTLVVWARQRSIDDNAAIIFASSGYDVAGLDPVPFAAAVVWADSLRGGRIIKNKIEAAIMMSGVFQQNHQTLFGSCTGAGPALTSATLPTQEWANQRAGWDSTAALNLPMSIAVQTDSIGALSWQVELLRKMRRAKLTPQDYAGTARSFTSGWNSATFMRGVQAGGNATRYTSPDLWGTSRARTWKPPVYANNTICTSADTVNAPCLLKWSFERAESLSRSLGLAGVDRVVWAPNMDWTPASITRTNATLLDSVLYYMHTVAGVRGFLATPENPDISPDVYSSAAVHPVGWGYQGSLGVKRDVTDGPNIGAIQILASRADASRPSNTPVDGHCGALQTSEFVSGWLSGRSWFPAYATLGLGGGANYHHDFFVPVNVLSVSVQNLGGNNAATPARHGFWAIKSLKNIVDMLNSFAYPGKTIAEIVYPEDLTR